MHLAGFRLALHFAGFIQSGVKLVFWGLLKRGGVLIRLVEHIISIRLSGNNVIAYALQNIIPTGPPNSCPAGYAEQCITYFFYVLERFYNTKRLNTLPS